MHRVGPLHPQTPNYASKTVQVFIEKGEYKWTHTVQTHVVQRSAVIFLGKYMLNI